MVGGYYDAGDNVKFGFPMAFTTTMLSWSVLEFSGFMNGELANSKDAIRWATDYLLKATAHPGTICVQVNAFVIHKDSTLHKLGHIMLYSYSHCLSD